MYRIIHQPYTHPVFLFNDRVNQNLILKILKYIKFKDQMIKFLRYFSFQIYIT